MMPKEVVMRWLDTLPAGSNVAVDDGGLCLVMVNPDDPEGNPDDWPYLEVGGVPEGAD